MPRRSSSVFTNGYGIIWVGLYPNGKVKGDAFILGNTQGKKGKSLEVALSGSQVGLWHDFETGEGGDIISLTAAQQSLDEQRDFPELIRLMADWLGMSSCPAVTTPVQQEDYEDFRASYRQVGLSQQ